MVSLLWLIPHINEFVCSSKWQIKDFKIVCLQMKLKRIPAEEIFCFVFTFLFQMFNRADGLKNSESSLCITKHNEEENL